MAASRPRTAARHPQRGRLEVKVWFLQGQGNDMVVLPISAAKAEGWYWPPDRGELLDTQEGHTHNVGDAGTRNAPRYPTEILNLHALPRGHAVRSRSCDVKRTALP